MIARRFRKYQRVIDAGDLAQQAWVYYLEKVKDAPQPNPATKRSVWETGAVYRLLYEYVRFWQRRLDREVNGAAEFRGEGDDRHNSSNVGTPDPAQSDEMFFGSAVARDLLDHLFDAGLGDDAEELIALRAAGHTAREIAGIVGSTEAAVWKRVSRMREKVARYLETLK